MPPVKSAVKTGAEPSCYLLLLKREEEGEGGRVISPRHENKNLEKEASLLPFDTKSHPLSLFMAEM